MGVDAAPQAAILACYCKEHLSHEQERGRGGTEGRAWPLTSLASSQRPVSWGACHPERLTAGLNASCGGFASLLSVHTCTHALPSQ